MKQVWSPRLKQWVLRSLIGLSVMLLVLSAARYARPPLSAGMSFSRAVQDRNGKLLRLTLSNDEKYRLWLKLPQISSEVVGAFLLGEDQHFRQHFGVNPVSLARAFLSTYLGGPRRMGGSTLTMQLARMRYGIRSHSFLGKLYQMARAVQLELFYSKNEILEAYLNLVPCGGNIEGVGAASLVYFQKEAARLTLSEALTLAVIPQNPNERNPLRLETRAAGSGPQALKTARARLYEKYSALYPDARALAPEFRLPIQIHTTSELPFFAPHFTEKMLRAREAMMDRAYIPSSLDLKIQTLLESRVRDYIRAQKHLGVKNASAVLIDTHSREVRGYVGSADFFDSSILGQVDGLQAKRSPGSALKPFVYALAMDQGLIHPYSLLKDAPTSFGAFDPENFDREFMGPLTAQDALIKSRNIPAVQLTANLQEPNLYQLMTQAGVTRLKSEKFYGLALPLGGAEVTALELAKMYLMFGNGGKLAPLRFEKRDLTKGVLQPKEETLISPESAFMVTDMLTHNARPEYGRTDPDWMRDSEPIAWKTGTSHGYHDAWTAGLFGHWTLVVWVGNFNGESNSSFIGRDIAAPLFFQITDALRAVDTERTLLGRLPPATLKRVEVCSVSGALPGKFCPHRKTTWYQPGKSPIHLCDIHREVELRPNGTRACPNGINPISRPSQVQASLRKEVYEFWPSDLLALFKKAGLPRRLPPPYEPSCPLRERTAGGLQPVITSPKKDLSYAVPIARRNEVQIPMSAVVDAGVREVFWFADEEFIGKSDQRKPFFWHPGFGHWTIRAVDDQGRSATSDVDVKAIQ